MSKICITGTDFFKYDLLYRKELLWKIFIENQELKATVRRILS